MSLTAQADLNVMLSGQARVLPLEQPKPAISVIGLGYVGAVSMACLAPWASRRSASTSRATASAPSVPAARRSSKSVSANCCPKVRPPASSKQLRTPSPPCSAPT